MVKVQRTSVSVECSVINGTSISHPLPTTSQKRRQKTCTSWRSGNTETKQCLLAMTGLLHELRAPAVVVCTGSS